MRSRRSFVAPASRRWVMLLATENQVAGESPGATMTGAFVTGFDIVFEDFLICLANRGEWLPSGFTPQQCSIPEKRQAGKPVLL